MSSQDPSITYDPKQSCFSALVNPWESQLVESTREKKSDVQARHDALLHLDPLVQDNDEAATPGNSSTVSCEDCGKWRRTKIGVNSNELPYPWFCSSNDWDEYNSCDKPSEVDE